MLGQPSIFLDTIRLGWTIARLTLDAQEVVTMRLTGFAGLWPLPPGEAMRMVAEKGPAFADAWSSGAMALVRGKTSSAAMDATLNPLHRRARANRKRLSGQLNGRKMLQFSALAFGGDTPGA
jgi:hypothetical protein